MDQLITFDSNNYQTITVTSRSGIRIVYEYKVELPSGVYYKNSIFEVNASKLIFSVFYQKNSFMQFDRYALDINNYGYMKVKRHICDQSVCSDQYQVIPPQEFVGIFISSVTQISYICNLDNSNININTVSPGTGLDPEIRKNQVTNSAFSYGYCSQIVVKDSLTSPTQHFYAMAYYQALDNFVQITGYLNLRTATVKRYSSALDSTHLRFLSQKIAKSSYDFVLTWGYYVDKYKFIEEWVKLNFTLIGATSITINNAFLYINPQSSNLPIETNKICRALSPPNITQITFELGEPSPQYFYFPKVDIDVPGWDPWNTNTCKTYIVYSLFPPNPLTSSHISVASHNDSHVAFKMISCDKLLFYQNQSQILIEYEVGSGIQTFQFADKYYFSYAACALDYKIKIFNEQYEQSLPAFLTYDSKLKSLEINTSSQADQHKYQFFEFK
eukprot:403334768